MFFLTVIPVPWRALFWKPKAKMEKKDEEEVKPYLIAIIGLGSLPRTTYDGQKDFLFASPVFPENMAVDWAVIIRAGEGQKYLRTEIGGSPRGGEKGNLSRVKDTSDFPILAVSTAGDQIREFSFPTPNRKKMNLSIFLWSTQFRKKRDRSNVCIIPLFI